jgi:uncharacterized protein YegJ (DUF2314 family)
MRAVLLLLLFVGCEKSAPSPAPPAVPTLRKDKVEEKVVVIVPKDADAAAIERSMHDRIVAAHLTGDVTRLKSRIVDEQDRELLKTFNRELTPEDLAGMSSGQCLGLVATGEPLPTLRAADAIALEAARKAHGWVLDEMSGVGYTAEQFATHVPGDAVDVRKTIVIHSVRGDDGMPFLDTMGMSKLGLPELRVGTAASSDVRSMARLINATAQHLSAHPETSVPGTLNVDFASLPGDWELAEIRKRGGTAKIAWHVRWVAEDGLQDLELVPGTGSGAEDAATLIDNCLGKVSDPLTTVGDDVQAELDAAAEHARKDLVALRSHFAHGVPDKEELSIKAPFDAEDGRTEWMWVDVLAWKGDTFSGTLDNDPEWVHSIRRGSKVSVPLAQVADYVHVHADGTRSGQYSVEILEKSEGSR